MTGRKVQCCPFLLINGVSLYIFFTLLLKDVDKLTCGVTETNYILASPSS